MWPSVGELSPATRSSSVDLPQPDGPTTEKNSQRRRSNVTGPSALTDAPPSGMSNTFVATVTATCALAHVETPAADTLCSINAITQHLLFLAARRATDITPPILTVLQARQPPPLTNHSS